MRSPPRPGRQPSPRHARWASVAPWSSRCCRTARRCSACSAVTTGWSLAWRRETSSSTWARPVSSTPSRRVGQLADVGAHLVEAPVSGSVAAAESRKLLIMAAGDGATARPRHTGAARHRRPGDRSRRARSRGGDEARRQRRAVRHQPGRRRIVGARRARRHRPVGRVRRVRLVGGRRSGRALPAGGVRAPGDGRRDLPDRPRDQGPRSRHRARLRGRGAAAAGRDQPGRDACRSAAGLGAADMGQMATYLRETP